MSGAGARLLAVAACMIAVGAAVAAGAAPPRTLVETARVGTLRAELTYRQTTETFSSVFNGKTTRFTSERDSDFRVTLRRRGRLLLSRALECDLCQPAGPDDPRPGPSVHFDRLRTGGEPQLLVDLFTGGAHCCFLTDVFMTGSPGPGIRELWGDPGYRLVDLGRNGVSEFVTADDRFAYEFTAYATSLLPLRILRLEGARLVDVTGSYPQLIEADAASAWALYQRTRAGSYPDVRGILAAWAADEARLGRWPAASAALARALARGDLNRGPAIAGWPIGRAYLAALHRFLIHLGYL